MVFFITKIKEPAPISFLITRSYGIMRDLVFGFVGELFQNTSYLFMSFKNPISLKIKEC